MGREGIELISNHYAPKLSELDKQIISHVPQGGNWKDIPESVPSQRIAQIRESYKAGKGSRSTYYGRLREDMPAYTISTYFPRPGNGCNIHYEQNRTLTPREAARLQSFPDSFVFKGSKTAINNQIGNAVPPLLAYQIAKALGDTGQFVDLFCGAGGLSLGFLWAGWKPIVGNDIDMSALETHRHNIQEPTICGDISSPEIVESIMQYCIEAKERDPNLPLFVIGGPPCQGFSTANRKNNMTDQRNWLFKSYVDILQRIEPTGFVFENVTGILSLDQGKFFEMILDDLRNTVPSVSVNKFNCAEYGIPQRRERVIVLGAPENIITNFSMPPISTVPKKKESLQLSFADLDVLLPEVISVKEALSDLPPVMEGEDVGKADYLFSPLNSYQALMRGKTTAQAYLESLQ